MSIEVTGDARDRGREGQKREMSELKRQAEEERKNRSAEEAARLGLDDFL